MHSPTHVVPLSLVLVALLLASCGGGGDSSRVAPTLQEVTLLPASFAGIECG